MDNKAEDLIKSFEGCKLTAYKCPAGVWTVGYGNTSYLKAFLPNPQNISITQEQANSLFDNDYNLHKNGVKRYFPVNYLNDNELGALTSFAFNLGIGRLQKSTLRKVILNDKQDYAKIHYELQKYSYAAGKQLLGLLRRRSAEFQLYISS